MNKGKMIFVVCLILLLTEFIESKLLFVFEAFNHGAKAPYGNTENGLDLFQVKWDAFGELTDLGHRMIYTLGCVSREKYKDFISRVYNPQEILIQSTNHNRTIESAYAFIQGLYSDAQGMAMEHEQLKFAIPPIPQSQTAQEHITSLDYDSLPHKTSSAPVHVFDETEYYYFVQELLARQCTPIMTQFESNRNSQELRDKLYEFNVQFANELKRVLIGLKLNMKEYTSLNTLCDQFIAGYTNGASYDHLNMNIDLNILEKECKEIFKAYLTEITFGKKTRNEILMITLSKPLRQIIEGMERRIILDIYPDISQVDFPSPKYIIHSGHDISLMAFMLFFNETIKIDIMDIDYASNLNLELHKNSNNKYIVKFLTNGIEQFELDYDVFAKLVKSSVWTDDNISTYCFPPKNTYIGLWITLWVLLSVFIILTITFFMMRTMLFDKKIV